MNPSQPALVQSTTKTNYLQPFQDFKYNLLLSLFFLHLILGFCLYRIIFLCCLYRFSSACGIRCLNADVCITARQPYLGHLILITSLDVILFSKNRVTHGKQNRCLHFGLNSMSSAFSAASPHIPQPY